MKKTIIIPVLFILTASLTVSAQPKKVNEVCSDSDPCETGLNCVVLKNETKKCSICDQSTLNDMTQEVDNSCKGFGAGWTPETSTEYQAGLSDVDGRVLVDVFDKMLENAKKCKQARQDRENKCWDGGDQDHKDQIEQVGGSIERMAEHKSRMIGDRRVYYGCSKSTYDGRVNAFKSTDPNFPDIDQKLSIMEKDWNDGKKINCSDIEKFIDDCQHCSDAGYSLMNDGFSGSSDKFPAEYNKKYMRAQELLKRAKDLLDAAKSKDLCN
jgi:hypothetical protein